MKIFKLFFAGIVVAVLLLSSCKKTANPDVVKIHLADEPDKLQPYFATNAYARQVMRHVFYTLMEYDPKTYAYSPMMAKAAPVIAVVDTGKNLRSFTYELLDEAVWDNGKPVLASDYEFSLKLILNPKSAASRWRPFFMGIKDFNIDPANPKKFTIIAENDLLVADAFGSIYILPEYIYDPKGLMKKFDVGVLANATMAAELESKEPSLQEFADFSSEVKFSREAGSVVGCGPYALTKWETGQYILLKKKENWWGNSIQRNLFAAAPEQLFYKILKDDPATIAEIKNGNLDIVGAIKPDNFLQLKSDPAVAANYNFLNPATLQYSYYVFNTKNDKLADVKVRQALAHLVDIPTVISKIMKGFAVPVTGPILAANTYANKTLQPIAYDPEQAKKLLKEAGWQDSNGDGTLDKMLNGKLTDLSIQLLYAPQGAGKDVTLMFQENCRKVGIKLDIVPKDIAGTKAEVKKRNFEMFLLASVSDLSMPDLFQAWHTSSDSPDGGNASGFGSPETDKILEEIRDTNDENRRRDLYLLIQQKIYEQQPYIFLVNPVERLVIHKKFEPATTIKRTGYGGYVESACKLK